MESFISLSIKRIEYFTSDIRIYCVHIFLFNFQLRNGFIICPNPGKKTDKDNIQNILKILFLHIKNTRHVSNITTIIDKNIIRAVKGKRYILKKTILNWKTLRTKIPTNNNMAINGIVLIKRLKLHLHGNFKKTLNDPDP